MQASANPTEPDDSALLGVTIELSNRLNLTYKPNGLTWMSTLQHPSNLPSDQTGFIIKGALRGRLVLPFALKGKLTLEEWRPLIGSGLVFTFRPEIRRVWRTLSPLLPASWLVALFALPALIGFSLLLTFSQLNLGAVFFGAELLAIYLVFVLLMRLSIHYYNMYVVGGLHLKADSMTARLLGPELFLGTLQKIDSMRIEDLEASKRVRRSVWPRNNHSFWPTLTERISNLERIVV